MTHVGADVFAKKTMLIYLTVLLHLCDVCVIFVENLLCVHHHENGVERSREQALMEQSLVGVTHVKPVIIPINI